MNLFAVHRDPRDSARALADRHVVKMTLETAQMLSAALHRYDAAPEGAYRATHKNHPCTRWVGDSRCNYRWAVEHGRALAAEYERRFSKQHKSLRVIDLCADHAEAIPEGHLTPFALAMPDEFKVRCPHASYRDYLRDKYRAWTDAGRAPKRTSPLLFVVTP
jgi:hypothetical protein